MKINLNNQQDFTATASGAVDNGAKVDHAPQSNLAAQNRDNFAGEKLGGLPGFRAAENSTAAQNREGSSREELGGGCNPGLGGLQENKTAVQNRQTAAQNRDNLAGEKLGGVPGFRAAENSTASQNREGSCGCGNAETAAQNRDGSCGCSSAETALQNRGGIHPSAQISPLAFIAPGAQIGAGCVIEAFASIGEQVVLGPDCHIHAHASIAGRTRLGAGCVIYPHAAIGGAPQDVSYTPGSFSALEIGARTQIREFATINTGTHKGDGYTRVGAGCFVMAYAHIAHDCCVGDGVILANGVTLAGHVQVGERSVIGGLTPVHQFVRIGRFCMLAGASALSQDLPDFCLAEGNRASVRSLNLVGLRRNFAPEIINELKAAFNLLFRQSSGNLGEKAAQLAAASECEQVRALCEFVMNTKRGINIYSKDNDER